jgi:ADP-heptose:LPS heptosyltransferase
VSGLVTRLSGAPLRIGLDRNREGNKLFLTHPVVPSRRGLRRHIVDTLLDFLLALGLPRPAALSPQTYLAQGEAERADALLSTAHGGPRVGLIVGASTADKAWPRERWAELVRLLAARGCQPVLLGGPGEANLAQAIWTRRARMAPSTSSGKRRCACSPACWPAAR